MHDKRLGFRTSYGENINIGIIFFFSKNSQKFIKIEGNLHCLPRM